MLQRLTIQNYAIIAFLDIEFQNHLTVITGETGAGKSILMGALGLILGERADSSVLQNREKKCVVEGHFLIEKKEAAKSFIEANELDNDELLVIRREIAPTGKSRAFINDTPATLVQLKELASLLVDLHQQFDTLELGDSDFQREVMDALAGNHEIIFDYQSQYKQWRQIHTEWMSLVAQKETFKKEVDYHQFIFNELDQLQMAENELEELEQELKLLSNAEGIKTALNKIAFELKESEQPLVHQLKQLANQLAGYCDFHNALPAITERMYSAQLELQDIADDLETIDKSIHFDQQRIDTINERLSAGYKLLKKHGVQTTNQLIEIREQMALRLQEVLNIDDAIAKKEEETNAMRASCEKIALELSNKRHKLVPSLEKNINRLLVQVGMPNARIKISITDTGLHQYGKDNIEFLLDANKSNRFEPVRKVASGGELSRLMLCIKSLVAESIDLPTLIFDEIDTGISGEAARQVGIIMKDLAKSRQVICITHQAQIAGKATTHFFVYKEIKNDVVTTGIRQLSQDERITAIARMLSGEKPTAAALENAREMVG